MARRKEREATMRASLIIAAAAVTLGAATADARSVRGAETAAPQAPDETRAWRIGDRPPASRWRAIRAPSRFNLPEPPSGGALAALDDSIVELDATGAIVRFHSL